MKISEWIETQTGSHDIQNHAQLNASFQKHTGITDYVLPSHTIKAARNAIAQRGLGGYVDGDEKTLVTYGFEIAIELARLHAPGYQRTKMGRGFAWREAIDALKAAGK